jgi:cyclin B
MDDENPQQVAEYMQDIFQVLKREEPFHMPSPAYMERQVHVNAKMRAILVDWLVDVHKKYKLRPETLFLAVNLIDRYLEIQVTAQRLLQLVGVTCLLIAAKFEEVYPPQIKDFVYVTDKAYSREDILKMEVSILKALQFKICRPTAMNFLERYQCVNGCTDAHRDLAQYLLELTLVDYKMLKYAPSHMAAACILLSNKLLRRPSWTPATVRHTKMTEPMLKECAKEMCVLLECAENNPLQAVRKKYSQTKHHAVAKLNFMAGPGAQAQAATAATAVSARERRSSTASTGRRSTSGPMELA